MWGGETGMIDGKRSSVAVAHAGARVAERGSRFGECPVDSLLIVSTLR